MLSDSGHLIFTTGNNKEIRFQTSETGRVKVNNEDLTQLLSQVNFRFYLFIINQILESIIKADWGFGWISTWDNNWTGKKLQIYHDRHHRMHENTLIDTNAS